MLEMELTVLAQVVQMEMVVVMLLTAVREPEVVVDSTPVVQVILVMAQVTVILS